MQHPSTLVLQCWRPDCVRQDLSLNRQSILFDLSGCYTIYFSHFGSLQLMMCLRRPSRWWVGGSIQQIVGEWAGEHIVTVYESCVDVCSRLVEEQETMGTSVETERPIVYFVYMVQPLLCPCSVSAVDVILRICASLYLHCPLVLVPFWLSTHHEVEAAQ